MLLLLFSTAEFPSVSELEKARDNGKLMAEDDEITKALLKCHLSQDSTWEDSSIDLNALGRALPKLEGLFIKHFMDGMTLKEKFHSHTKNHEENFEKYRDEVFEYLLTIDTDQLSKVKPAARWHYICYMRGLNHSVGLVLFTPSFVERAHESLQTALPGLKEVRRHRVSTDCSRLGL